MCVGHKEGWGKSQKCLLKSYVEISDKDDDEVFFNRRAHIKLYGPYGPVILNV